MPQLTVRVGRQPVILTLVTAALVASGFSPQIATAQNAASDAVLVPAASATPDQPYADAASSNDSSAAGVTEPAEKHVGAMDSGEAQFPFYMWFDPFWGFCLWLCSDGPACDCVKYFP